MNDVKEFSTIRVVFSKTGAARYISHLDLNRTMIRAIRRAELPIWYTEGFNKHPYVTFAAPLSLGFEGERETMDIRLNEEMSMEQVVARLNATMPVGLRVISAAPAVRKAGEIHQAVYRLTLGCRPEDVQGFLAQSQIVVQKRTKKKTMKDIDLRPVLDEADSRLVKQEAGMIWQLTLPCNSTDSVNPSLIAQALCEYLGQESVSLQVRRLCVLDAEGKEFL